jgi:cold shock CspA family protein
VGGASILEPIAEFRVCPPGQSKSLDRSRAPAYKGAHRILKQRKPLWSVVPAPFELGASRSNVSSLEVLPHGPERPDHPFFLGKQDMSTGTVKWFNDSKGFGFIKPDDGGEDLFAHFSQIQGAGFKTLKENQRVSFEVTQGPKGKQASGIKPL